MWNTSGLQAKAELWPVAALQDAEPHLKGKLQVTWRLLKTWHVNEIPNRAPPMPETVLHAMLGWCLFHEHYAFCASLCLAFYGLLRTGDRGVVVCVQPPCFHDGAG